MVMFRIVPTSNGPVVEHAGRSFTIRDYQDMIAVAEDEPAFIEAMNAHIIETLFEYCQEFVEAYNHRYALEKHKVVAYLDAADQFLGWENFSWMNYRESLKQIGATE